jgi:hypothetical protein
MKEGKRMLKWIWRILYFVIIALLSLQVYGYAYFTQLEAYYSDEVAPFINENVSYLEGMNTLIGLTYFQETPIVSYAFNEGNYQLTVSIHAVGALTEEASVDGYAIFVNDVKIIHEGVLLERPIIKITSQVSENTMLVDAAKTNRRSITFDPGNPFSYQNVPVFFLFDYDNYLIDSENNLVSILERIEIQYGYIENDAYVFEDQYIFLASTEVSNEAVFNQQKVSGLTILPADYQLMANLNDTTPSDEELELYGLNANRGDITAYSYIMTRAIVIYIVVIFIFTYFLFFHKSVRQYFKQKKNPPVVLDNSIFKD